MSIYKYSLKNMDLKNFHQIRIFFKKLYEDNELIPLCTIFNLEHDEIIKSIRNSFFEENMKNNFIEIVEFIYSEYSEKFNIVIIDKQISKIFFSIQNSDNKETIYYSYDEYEYNNVILKIKNLETKQNLIEDSCFIPKFDVNKILLVSTILLSGIMVFGYILKN